MAKMAASMGEHGEDAFRKLFKLYKRRNPPPDFSNVVDFSATVKNAKVFPTEIDHAAVTDGEAMRAGLRPVEHWRAFGLEGYPGFIFISNPFLPGSQRYWVRQCLKTFPQKPNVCNLDMHMTPSETQDVWGQSADLLRNKGSGKREPRTLLEKLRWVTLGYHYDWNTKTYSPDHHTAFPADLQSVSRHVAAACGFPGFLAEAGILNYYRSDSALGIHVDESELDRTRPLLSFSFGQSAVFLLGGTEREAPPTAMYMHSGDVMVMSGHSRLLYHAVPRILPAPEGDPLHPRLGTEGPEGPDPDQGLAQDRAQEEGAVVGQVSAEDWAVCARYIQTSRVNMTVRQVLGPGQAFPPATDTPTRTEESHAPGYHQPEDGEGVVDEKRRRRSDSSDAAES